MIERLIERHIDSLKGCTVAAYNIAAVALSHATAIAWLQIVSLLIGIAVGLLTIWEKVRKNRLKLVIFGAALALSGCAAPKMSRHALDGTRQVQAATVHVEKAKAASARAKESIATGKSAAAELKRTATPAQKPHVAKLTSSLAQVEQENEIMRVSLNEAAPKLDAAQASIDALGLKLLRAEEHARDYRWLKGWLALLAGLSAAYVAFRAVPIPPVRYWAMLGAGGGAAILVWILL